MTNSVNDQQLVEAVRDGDESASTELYQRYARRVVGLVDSQMSDWLRGVTEAEDIAQSVFRSIFRGVQGGDYEAPPGNTLWSLIAVIAVRKTRRRATHHLAKRRDSKRSVALEPTDAVSSADGEEFASMTLDLRDALASLSEGDQETLALRIQGNTVEEIAETLNRSGRTIERRLQRIREHLADILLDDFSRDEK